MIFGPLLYMFDPGNPGDISPGDTPPPQVGLVEFEVDRALWWKRKPKKLDEEEAQEQLETVAEAIAEVVEAQIEERKPEPARRAEAKRAIAPIAAEMPGFDWVALYDRTYETALKAAIAAEFAARVDKRQEAIDKALMKKRRDEMAVMLLAKAL